MCLGQQRSPTANLPQIKFFSAYIEFYGELYHFPLLWISFDASVALQASLMPEPSKSSATAPSLVDVNQPNCKFRFHFISIMIDANHMFLSQGMVHQRQKSQNYLEERRRENLVAHPKTNKRQQVQACRRNGVWRWQDRTSRNTFRYPGK